MNLGTLKQTTDETTGAICYSGCIRTYSLDLDIRLEFCLNRKDENSPTHVVIGRGKHGKFFQAGVCWEGKTREGDKRMFSLSLSIPEIGYDNERFVAWENREGGFDIQASKPQEQAA